MGLKLLIVITLIIILSGCTEYSEHQKPTITITTKTNEIDITVEVADEPQEIQTGLMYREKLDKDSGMLFIFQDEKPVSFWMKNTKIPLDMIFLLENGTVSEVKSDVQPCVRDPCMSYPSKNPTKYVIEVNAGFCEENDIRPGDKVDLETLKD